MFTWGYCNKGATPPPRAFRADRNQHKGRSPSFIIWRRERGSTVKHYTLLQEEQEQKSTTKKTSDPPCAPKKHPRQRQP